MPRQYINYTCSLSTAVHLPPSTPAIMQGKDWYLVADLAHLTNECWPSKHLTLARLNLFQETKKFIEGLVQGCNISIATALKILQSCTKPSVCAFFKMHHQFSKLRWWRYLTFLLIKDKDLFILHRQCLGCWWLGNLWSQGINRNGIFFYFSRNILVSMPKELIMLMKKLMVTFMTWQPQAN